MAELADALDLGSSGKPCGFESHYPHFKEDTWQYLPFCDFITQGRGGFMVVIDVKLNSIDKVKKFWSLANTQNYDIQLFQSRCPINAKSIMGIFSLDLTRPITAKFPENVDGEEFITLLENEGLIVGGK